VFEKYFVIIGEQVVCLKYNLRTGEMTVGGSIRFREAMERILTGYIVGHVPRVKFTQSNKIRFVFTLSRKRYDKALSDLREEGFVVERTQSHGRLMR
jgi:hypothetical protein